jgi:hypothetical protein
MTSEGSGRQTINGESPVPGDKQNQLAAGSAYQLVYLALAPFAPQLKLERKR